MNFICEWLFTAIKDNKSLIAYQLGANRMCSVDLCSEMLALIILTFFALLTRELSVGSENTGKIGQYTALPKVLTC